MSKLKIFVSCMGMILGTVVFVFVYTIFFSDGIVEVGEDSIAIADQLDSKFVVEKVIKEPPKVPDIVQQGPSEGTITGDDISDIPDVDVNVQQIAVDVANYSGNAQFLWVSDLHMISDDSASGRYADILGDEYNGAAILKAAVSYANENSLPIVLGADIIDYASNANFDNYKRVMSNASQSYWYIRADHDVATDLNNPDGLSDGNVSLPGAVPGSHKVVNIDGVNVILINMSTNRSGESSVNIEQLSNGPTVICTHVPFPIGDTESWITSNPMSHNLGVSRPKPYNWSYSGTHWLLGSNDRMRSIYETSLNNDNVSAVFCGHTHLKSSHITSGDGLQQVLLGPAFAGNIYHIIMN